MPLPANPSSTKGTTFTKVPFAFGAPPEGPNSFVTSIVVPAGSLVANISINFSQFGLSQVVSALVQNASASATVLIKFGSEGVQFGIATNETKILPVYSTSVTLFIGVVISLVQVTDTVILLQLFNTLQPLGIWSGTLTAGITGTVNSIVQNFPATQLVSAVSLPLPAGASTSAKQPALDADGGAPSHVTNFPATQPVSAVSLPLPAGASTAAKQPVLDADGGALSHVQNFPATQPVSGAVTANAGTNLNTSALALDATVRSYQGAVAITVGTAYAAGRALAVNCTAAGNVTITFADASTMTFAVVVGFTIFNFATTKVNSTTSTATFFNLV